MRTLSRPSRWLVCTVLASSPAATPYSAAFLGLHFLVLIQIRGGFGARSSAQWAKRLPSTSKSKSPDCSFTACREGSRVRSEPETGK